MVQTHFTMARCGATRLLWPFVRGEQVALIDGDLITVRVGNLGRAEIPVELVDRLSTVRWPWWSGIGVRIVPKMVAFATAPGRLALLELAEPITVKTPFRWTTARVAIGVVDVDEFIRVAAHARAAAAARREVPES